MSEIGEGFIIDYDGGTTPFEGTSIEDWVIDLLLFVFPNPVATLDGARAAHTAETLARWTEDKIE